MDAVLSNCSIMLIGASLGAVVGIIGALSSCMMKSRCTNIKSPCMPCEREPLDNDNPVYIEKPNRVQGALWIIFIALSNDIHQRLEGHDGR